MTTNSFWRGLRVSFLKIDVKHFLSATLSSFWYVAQGGHELLANSVGTKYKSLLRLLQFIC